MSNKVTVDGLPQSGVEDVDFLVGGKKGVLYKIPRTNVEVVSQIGHNPHFPLGVIQVDSPAEKVGENGLRLKGVKAVVGKDVVNSIAEIEVVKDGVSGIFGNKLLIVGGHPEPDKVTTTQAYSQVIQVDNNASLPHLTSVYTDLLETKFAGAMGSGTMWHYKLLFKGVFDTDMSQDFGEEVWPFIISFKGFNQSNINVYNACVNASHVSAMGEIPLMAVYAQSSTLARFNVTLKRFAPRPPLPTPSRITGLLSGSLEFLSGNKVI